MNMKRIAAAAVALAATGMLAAGILAVPFANAQLFTYGATTTTASTSVVGTTTPAMAATATSMNTIAATSSTSSTSSSSLPSPTIVVTTTITPPASVNPAAGFIQFNGLVVNSIGSVMLPTTIDAMASGTVSCVSYATEFADTGTAIDCPIPSTASSTFQINVTNATQLLLNDRTSAALGNITPGDTINVFGYFDGADMIQAQIVRDTSKPVVGIGTITSVTTVTGNGTSKSTTAETTTSMAGLQAEIVQIETLISQLIAQFNALNAANGSTTTVSSTTMTSP